MLSRRYVLKCDEVNLQSNYVKVTVARLKRVYKKYNPSQ